MSYSIYLIDPVTKTTLELDNLHDIKGGNYVIGGTTEAYLNITYNYGKHFRRVIGANGISTIYGMTGAESIPILEKAMIQLSNDVSKDYWEPTEGNARKALKGLLFFARQRPDGIWDGD